MHGSEGRNVFDRLVLMRDLSQFHHWVRFVFIGTRPLS